MSIRDVLFIGDTIKCKDADDAINVMRDLGKSGYDVDFVYEKDGVKGIWLEITRIPY